MMEFLKEFAPISAPFVALLASFIGARAGRRQLLDQATSVLNEQAEEAVVQYKALKLLLDVVVMLVDSLHRNGLLNGDEDKLRHDIANIKNMMDEDVVEKKKKTLFLRR